MQFGVDFFLFSSFRNDRSYKSSISRSRQKTGRWLQSFGTAINHHDVQLLCWQVGRLYSYLADRWADCSLAWTCMAHSKAQNPNTQSPAMQTFLSRRLHQTELNYQDTHNLRLTWAASRDTDDIVLHDGRSKGWMSMHDAWFMFDEKWHISAKRNRKAVIRSAFHNNTDQVAAKSQFWKTALAALFCHSDHLNMIGRSNRDRRWDFHSKWSNCKQ